MDLENKVWICSGYAELDVTTLAFYIDMDPIHTPFKNFGFEFELQGPGANIEGPGQGNIFMVPDYVENLPNSVDEETGETIFPYMVERHFINNLYPDTEYTLQLSCKNRREFFEDTFSFVTPKPEQPYPDWTWNARTKEWEPPVQKPDLIWDPETQQWHL